MVAKGAEPTELSDLHVIGRTLLPTLGGAVGAPGPCLEEAAPVFQAAIFL